MIERCRKKGKSEIQPMPSSIDTTATEDQYSPRVSLRRLLRNVGIFFITLCLGSTALNYFVPNIPDEINSKLKYFKLRKDDYDVMFFGSSVIRFQVNPLIFDAHTAALGHPTSSFNMGVNGIWGHEMNVLLNLCLAQNPRKLQTVFIDTRQWPVRIPVTNRFSERAIWWHTTSETLSVSRSIVRSSYSASEKLRLLLLHSQHWGMRAGQIGNASIKLQEIWGLNKPNTEYFNRYTTHEGFTPLPDEHGFGEQLLTYLARERGNSPSGRSPEQEIELYSQRVEQARLASQNDSTPLAVDPELARLISSQLAHLASDGITAIFLTPPVLTDDRAILALYQEKLVAKHLTYHNPNKYPELYEIRYRHDFSHLNESGAELFSGLLAKDYIESIETK